MADAFDVPATSHIDAAALAWGLAPTDLSVEDAEGPVPNWPADVVPAPLAPEPVNIEARRLLRAFKFPDETAIDNAIDAAWASVTPTTDELEQRRAIVKRIAKLLLYLLRAQQLD
jgi:hypothetical protein